ncbi:pyridoxamine 5'-phosphate oxidase family protein [Ferrimicrobium acidiphilum]|uniref:Pyridoxamine 5'-phosphate oxidase family protein n=1 Tax=Ferrimicrobium acidiphilum TaxID=121039 RepID=A0ABV3Y074_9ACTN
MERTQLTRERHRASRDRRALYRLLDAQIVGHVGVTTSHGPLVVPTAIARVGDQLLLHGSVASGWMRLVKKGAAVAIEVTQVDGIIVARSSFASSIRYESGVVFGTPEPVAEADKLWALRVITEKLIPGRSREIRLPTAKELAQTVVLTMEIEEWSLKVSEGWPEDAPDDVASDKWAGVVLHQQAPGLICDMPGLPATIAVPPSVRALAAGWDSVSQGPPDLRSM